MAGLRFETNRIKVVARLQREGWAPRYGGRHDVYQHPARPDRVIIVPRHRTLSIGVARSIAKAAGWID
jgi:predicted RNA binding protein YcfA (HicA-like mRNA interferase family)